MIPIEIQNLIHKYRYGFEPKPKEGKRVKANPIPNYERFYEILAELSAYLISQKMGVTNYNFNYSNCWANNLKEFGFMELERYLENK